MVAADLIGDDLVLCQITSRQPSDVYAVEIDEADFLEGGLKRPSYVRTNRLFTADRRIIAYKAGRLRSTKLLDITKAIISLLEN